MIYNLSEYIKVNLSLTPITNGFSPDSTVQGVYISQDGGIDTPFYSRKDYTVQVLTRYQNTVTGKVNIDTIYNYLTNKFAFDLPAVTVASVLYASIRIAQVLPLQLPTYLGADVNGNHIYTFNIKVTLG